MHLWLVWNLHLCNLCHAFMRPLPKHIEVCAYPSRSMKQMQWKPPAGICRRRLIIAIYQISAFCQEQIASGTKNPSKKELERSDQMNQFSSTGYKPQPSTNLPVSKRRNSLSLLGLRSINFSEPSKKVILSCNVGRLGPLGAIKAVRAESELTNKLGTRESQRVRIRGQMICEYLRAVKIFTASLIYCISLQKITQPRGSILRVVDNQEWELCIRHILPKGKQFHVILNCSVTGSLISAHLSCLCPVQTVQDSQKDLTATWGSLLPQNLVKWELLVLNAALSLSMLEKTLANAPAVPHRVFRVQPSPVTNLWQRFCLGTSTLLILLLALSPTSGKRNGSSRISISAYIFCFGSPQHKQKSMADYALQW